MMPLTRFNGKYIANFITMMLALNKKLSFHVKKVKISTYILFK